MFSVWTLVGEPQNRWRASLSKSCRIQKSASRPLQNSFLQNAQGHFREDLGILK